MRKKAEGAGNLKSSEQQKVETKVVENKQVVIIEQASPEVVYVPATTQPSCMGLPFIRIPRSPIRRLATMRLAWPYRSVSALRWEPSGAAALGGDADGAETTTSPLTTTTTSSTTATGRTSTTRTAAIAHPLSPQEVIVIGNTILSTAGARHIPTGLLRTGLAVLLEAIPSRTGRRTHARTRPDNNLRAATGEAWVIDNSPAEAIAALVIEIRPTVVPAPEI